MNKVQPLVIFLIVMAIIFPLYEGTTAFVVSIFAGTLAAILIINNNQQKEKQLNTIQQELKESSQQSTERIVEGLNTYQNQLVTTVADLSKQTNESLVAIWKETQEQLLNENKEMRNTVTHLVGELSSLQQQQQQFVIEITGNLEKWLIKQKKVSEETFSFVQQSHQTLLEDAQQSNEQMKDLWSKYQQEQLHIRQAEQKTFNEMIASIEEKEAAYSKHLEEQRVIFEIAQQQLNEMLSKQLQLSKAEMLSTLEKNAEKHLLLRQQEHTHIMDTQKMAITLIDQHATQLNERIISSWNETRQSFEELRKSEDAHMNTMLDNVEKANNTMLTTLDQQQQTFNTAQTFYSNTYEEIKTYTSQLNQHEETLGKHHQQLIDTQLSIKDTIAKTLQETFNEYTDVLFKLKETLASNIEELKDQRAVSEESFGEFIEAFLEGTEIQEKVTKDLLETLQTEISNLLEDSSTHLQRAITNVARTTESQNAAIEEVVDSSKGVLEQNQQVLLSLKAQVEETRNTAKLLERAFKEVTTLNKNDMDILQRLMG